jgi:hypothetical protein
MLERISSRMPENQEGSIEGNLAGRQLGFQKFLEFSGLDQFPISKSNRVVTIASHTRVAGATGLIVHGTRPRLSGGRTLSGNLSCPILGSRDQPEKEP